MYKKYTDDDLIEAYHSMMNYSGKVSDDLTVEIDKRGGIDVFLQKIKQKKEDSIEADRILDEIRTLIDQGYDLYYAQHQITSELWDKDRLNEFIENRYYRTVAIKNDLAITPKTIYGSLIGMIIGGIVGALVIHLIGSLIPGLGFSVLIPVYIVNYFIIKFITKQSRNNLIVFIAAFLSVVLSALFLVLFVYIRAQ